MRLQHLLLALCSPCGALRILLKKLRLRQQETQRQKPVEEPSPGAEWWLLRTGTADNLVFQQQPRVPGVQPAVSITTASSLQTSESPICNSPSSCGHTWRVSSCSVSQKHGTISGHCRFFALLLGKQQFAVFLLDFSSLFRINFPFPLCGREVLQISKQKRPCF